MTGQQKFTLFLTFITGAFAGAYLYVTSFAPQYTQVDVPEKSDISIVGEMYGGCARGGGCVSFRFSETGEYQYLLNEDDRQNGKLSDDVLDAVLSALSSYRLKSYSAPVAIRDCRSYVDGIDYRYEIDFEGERYKLDTCSTLFPHESELQIALRKAWEYMEEPATEYPVILEEGVGSWFIKKFQEDDE